MKNVKIAGREVGPGNPPFVIAELSGNHNGKLDRALQLIDAAADAGVDAVKLQTYTPDTLTIDHDGPGFLIEQGPWEGRTLYELYQEAHTPWEWHKALFSHGKQRGLIVLSSPFDETAIGLLETLGAPAYKIASFEIVDVPLIQRAAATGKPVIISTGLASTKEIGDAVKAARDGEAGGIVLLHCISGYPTPVEQANLRRITLLAQDFECVAGLSDHSLGTEVAIASVAVGAHLIEKHLTLNRREGGPDSSFSLEPNEFSQLVKGVRIANVALGTAKFEHTRSEAPNLLFRRSIYVVRNIERGELFTKDNIRSIRPGLGMAPKYLPKLINRAAAIPLKRGTPLRSDAVVWD